MTDATRGSQPPDSVLAFVRGDRAEAEQLRRELELTAEHVRDRALADRIRAVLDGRTPLRELIRDPAYVALLDHGMSTFRDQLAPMSPEERVELARRGQREAAALRDELGLPPEADPAPVGDFGPARRDLDR